MTGLSEFEKVSGGGAPATHGATHAAGAGDPVQGLVSRYGNVAGRAAAIPAPALNQLSMLDNRPGVRQYWNGAAWLDEVPLLLSGTASGTTNAGAFFSFGFPASFGANPQVFVQNIAQQAPYLFCLFPSSSNRDQAAFTMHLPATGAGANNTAYSIFWLAIGPRPAPS